MRLMKTLKGKARGQAILIVALMMVVLLGFVGLAVDGGQLYLTQRRARNAADAAMLGATYELCKTGDPTDAIADNVRQAGLNAAFDNGFDDSLPDQSVVVLVGKENTLLTTVPGNPAEYVEVEINVDVPTYLIQLVYSGSTEINVTSLGRCQPEQTAASGFAACALNGSPSDGKGISISSSGGNVTICYGDLGTNSAAHFANGNTVVTCDYLQCPDYVPENFNPSTCDPHIIADGGLAGGSSGTYTPSTIDSGTCEDNLLDLPYPGPCNKGYDPDLNNAYDTAINSDVVIQLDETTGTDVYCIDGIAAGNGDNIELNGPGVFYLTGDWSQNAASSVVSVNNAMVFLDDGSDFDATNGTIYLRAMKPETYADDTIYAGMAVFSHRNNSASISFTGASKTIFGTVYAPRQLITITGGSDDLLVAQLMVSELDLSGQGGLRIYYDEDWFFRWPPELKIGS